MLKDSKSEGGDFWWFRNGTKKEDLFALAMASGLQILTRGNNAHVWRCLQSA